MVVRWNPYLEHANIYYTFLTCTVDSRCLHAHEMIKSARLNISVEEPYLDQDSGSVWMLLQYCHRFCFFRDVMILLSSV